MFLYLDFVYEKYVVWGLKWVNVIYKELMKQEKKAQLWFLSDQEKATSDADEDVTDWRKYRWRC